MPDHAEPITRCPYCRVGREFRAMTEQIEGWFRCESCGHNVMPLDLEFRCACLKCDASQSQVFPE
jgi:Zn finger protein HypA/HybF involved in hydrogenase expression